MLIAVATELISLILLTMILLVVVNQIESFFGKIKQATPSFQDCLKISRVS